MASIMSLFVSILILFVALEGFAVMLRGIGLRWSPLGWLFRTLVNIGERILRWVWQQGIALLRWLVVSLFRLFQAGVVAWWASRRTNPAVFRAVGAVMGMVVLGVAIAAVF